MSAGLTSLEQRKLQLMLTDERLKGLSSQEALELAIQAEEFASMCGPFDPAFAKFKGDQLRLEALAALLEKRENAEVAHGLC